jgi:hypothetical protein
VVGGGGGVALAAVADDHLHPLDPGLLERAAGAVGEGPVALDAPHPCAERDEDRGVIARAGADVEHAVTRPQPERLAHQGHHERLGDRLAAADRQRRVLPGAGAHSGGHEGGPRHGPDRGQDALVGDGASQLRDERLGAHNR